MFCTRCGQPSASEAEFCTACGTPALPPLAGAGWYYARDGVRRGPVDEREIPALFASGVLTESSHVWNNTMQDWMPVVSSPLRHLIRPSHVPPPLSGTAVNNTAVWVLAFAPLLGLLLEAIVSDATDISVSRLWWLTVGLNLGLSVWDEHNLKAGGIDTSDMGGAWIVPVYLYKRAQRLGQSPAYFWVWCAMFALVLFD